MPRSRFRSKDILQFERSRALPGFFLALAKCYVEIMTATPTSSPERTIYTVSRLNRETKLLLEGSFPLIWVEGEISNLSRPASGHIYFSLKDSQAQIRCALFRGNQRGLGIALRDGMQVVVRARVTLYEGRGDYQLVVESAEDAGEGALRRAFEELRQRLATEGLFDASAKKPLPRLPRRIGLLTSPSGAVVHDILTTLKRRFPAIPVLLHPVPVQGQGAAEKIAAMIRLAGERGDCDVLILARGGGSLEDLWAFNEEVVARAIYACPVPIVSGVGHETDVTIADLVADARAPTPTAAAEMLSPNRADWLAAIERQQQRLMRLIASHLHDVGQHLDHLSARLVHPRDRLARLNDRFTAMGHRLRLGQTQTRQRFAHALLSLQARLREHDPRGKLRAGVQQLTHERAMLEQAMHHVLARHDERLARSAHTLDALSPLATLTRGYAVLQKTDGSIIRRCADTRPEDALRARLADGTLECLVKSVKQDA
jgi:exodeoxyribonuclease VII large subunit